jgi:hypothetical protein
MAGFEQGSILIIISCGLMDVEKRVMDYRLHAPIDEDQPVYPGTVTLPYIFGSNFIARSYTISEYDGPVFVAFSK